MMDQPNLLRLPCEIRRTILQELLCRDQPIGHPNLVPLQPAILCACKQLYQEGKLLLSTNTLHCGISDRLCSIQLSTHTSQLEEWLDTPQRSVIVSLLWSAIKVQVVVRIDNTPRWDKIGLTRLLKRMRAFVKLLRQASEWQDITIQIFHPRTQKLRIEKVEDALRPLQYLRKRRMMITGLATSKCLQDLIVLIQSDEPVLDLDTLHEELVCYSGSLLSGGFVVSDDKEQQLRDQLKQRLQECRNAADDRRSEDFKSARTCAMEVAGIYYDHKKQRVFQNDPPEWRTEEKLATSDIT